MKRCGLIMVLCSWVTFLCGLPATGTEDRVVEEPEKYTIRLNFREGQKLKYSLSLKGKAAWTPHREGLSRGEMSTEFIFTLKQKAIRATRACTYELFGEKLKSKGRNNKGSYSISATPARSVFKLNGKKFGETNPLDHEMSLTFGVLGMVRSGTGLIYLAPYFLPQTDHNFWKTLTRAPLKAVGVGDTWVAGFLLKYADSAGWPFTIEGKGTITGWETYDERKCLAGTVTAELEIKDTEVMLKNGERILIKEGSYRATGKVLWDIDRGELAYADAETNFSFQADHPEIKNYSARANCTLKLLASE